MQTSTTLSDLRPIQGRAASATATECGLLRLAGVGGGLVWLKAMPIGFPWDGADGTPEGIAAVERRVVDVLRTLAQEANEAGVAAGVIILPDLTIDVSLLRSALVIGGSEPFLELVSQGAPPDAESADLRRSVQERVGLSLTPHGADILRVALEAAEEVRGEVLALVETT